MFLNIIFVHINSQVYNPLAGFVGRCQVNVRMSTCITDQRSSLTGHKAALLSVGWSSHPSRTYNILLPIRHTFTIISLYMLSAGMLFLFTSYRIMQPLTACIIYVRVMSVYFLLKRTSPSGPGRAFYVSFFSKNYPTLAYSLTWLSNVALLINYSDYCVCVCMY